MDYTISKADGTTLLSVLEGQTSASAGYSVTFVGKNFPAYGSYINNNFLRLLENSAKTTAPAVPVKGQIWYDSTNNLVKVYNGTAWLTVGPNAASTITVKDEGTNLTTALASIDFVGAGVTATNSSGAITVTIPGGGGGSSYTLPTASNSTLGGVKVDATSITINSTTGVISAGTLDSLSDVVITSPALNQVVTYNGTNWVNGTLNLSNNADIVDLKKKMFLLEKFGSLSPTVRTPPSPVPYSDENIGNFNMLAADIFVGRNTWSDRIYARDLAGNTTSVAAAQLFENTSGYDIDLIIKVSITSYSDDQTKFRMKIDDFQNAPVAYTYSDEKVYHLPGVQQTFNNVYTYTARVPNGATYRFGMEGLVGSGSNGRGLDFVAGMMYINFGAWV